MSEIQVAARTVTDADTDTALRRDIDWRDAFWVASGVPALVLFSIGGIAATVGTPSYLVWTVSVTFGFIQAFTYAEIAGLFPGKSGGVSVYGAIAWVPYGKLLPPLSVWCNWLAWSPVLAIGCGLGAGYILTSLFAPDAAVRTWEVTLIDLSALKDGLRLRINATFIIGAVLLLITFAVQNRGILRTARVQTVIGVVVVVPLLLIALVPLLTGDVTKANLTPLMPIGGTDSGGNPIPGEWNKAGWTVFFGGLFLAAWSTYAFETAICYTREFKRPRTDTFKAIFTSGLLCLVIFSLVPLAFQGTLGLKAMLDPGIYDGSGVAAAMAKMVGGGNIIGDLIVIMLILALILSIITAMAGSSRTLYQGSVDGWLPKYLSYVNAHGAPARAMWTDLGFNLALLLMSDYVFVLAVSNCCYLFFNFLNLHAGWIHRIDNAHVERPWRAPNWLLGAGAALAFVNAFLLGAGSRVYGEKTLATGIIAAALIVPVFLYRHYVTDKGEFPVRMLADLKTDLVRPLADRSAGLLPYITLIAGAAVITVGAVLFR
jgi:amino acid transporter